MKKTIKKLTYSAMFLAIALILPFLTGQIQQIGNALLPMHLPVLLCGFICGWPWGLLIGFIAPLLRFALFQMPPIFPIGTAMAFELAMYGFAAGLLYKKLPKKALYIYINLIVTMIAGRIVWGAVQFFIAGIRNTNFGLQAFWAGAVLNAIPGIICQIILIPVIVIAFSKSGLFSNEDTVKTM